MKKTFLTSLCAGFMGALICVSTIAATFNFQLTLDGNNRIQLTRNLVSSNGITVTTNMVLKANDGVGFWRIVVTNLTGGIGVVTNSGAN